MTPGHLQILTWGGVTSHFVGLTSFALEPTHWLYFLNNITPIIGSRTDSHAMLHHKWWEDEPNCTQHRTTNRRKSSRSATESHSTTQRTKSGKSIRTMRQNVAHACSGQRSGKLKRLRFPTVLALILNFRPGQLKLQNHGHKGVRIHASSAAANLQRFSAHTFNENQSHTACSDRHQNLPPPRQENLAHWFVDTCPSKLLAFCARCRSRHHMGM